MAEYRVITKHTREIHAETVSETLTKGLLENIIRENSDIPNEAVVVDGERRGIAFSWEEITFQQLSHDPLKRWNSDKQRWERWYEVAEEKAKAVEGTKAKAYGVKVR